MADKELKALSAVSEYLKSKGWNPAVIGFDTIEQGDRKHNFRLVIKFTGTKAQPGGDA